MKLLIRQSTTDDVLRRLSLAKRIVALEVRANRDKRDSDEVGIVAIFRKPNQILLAQRKYQPEAGKWALPGGHVHYGESLEAATRREVLEEVGLTLGPIKEIRSWQVPQGPKVHLFYATCPDEEAKALSETSDVMWADVEHLPNSLAWNNAVLIPEIAGTLGERINARDASDAIAADQLPNHHLSAQDAAAARYRNDVRRFVHVVEADVARKKRSRDDLMLYWLMLMEDSERTEFEHMTQRLAHAQALPFIGGEGLRSAAESFAQERKPLLQNFAAEAYDTVRKGESGLVGARKAGETVLAGAGERLAATEAVATYGGAQIRLLKQAGFTHKAWETMDDDRVRDSHRQCEAQGSIPIDDKFHNGLQYPGDPEGGPEETVNCRCWLTGQGRMNQ